MSGDSNQVFLCYILGYNLLEIEDHSFSNVIGEDIKKVDDTLKVNVLLKHTLNSIR